MSWLEKIHELIFNPSDHTSETIQTQTERIEIENEFLRKVEYRDVDFFHLTGYECWAKVVKIYDADTIHCVFFINGKAFKFKVRLSGIDTAERKSTDPAEREWSRRAIQRMYDLIGRDLVFLKCHRWDKYGRLLGEIYHDQQKIKSYNQILLDEGYAYAYDGDKRIPFREWVKNEELLSLYPSSDENETIIDNINDTEVFDPVTDTDYQAENNAGQSM